MDPSGMDLMWIASDDQGRVAAFFTGGSGPVPKVVLRGDRMPADEIEGLVCALPEISAVRLLIEDPRPDDFLAMAKRGVFVYDWKDVHRKTVDESNCYELVAVPEIPLSSGDFPEVLREILQEVTIKGTAFSTSLTTIAREAVENPYLD